MNNELVPSTLNVVSDCTSFQSGEIQSTLAWECRAIWPPDKYIPFYTRRLARAIYYMVSISHFHFSHHKGPS